MAPASGLADGKQKRKKRVQKLDEHGNVIKRMPSLYNTWMKEQTRNVKKEVRTGVGTLPTRDSSGRGLILKLRSILP